MVFFTNKRNIIIFLIVIILLILSGYCIYYLTNVRSKPVVEPAPQAVQKPSEPLPFPEPVFNNWELSADSATSMVQPLESSSLYTFKSHFSEEERFQLATFFGVEENFMNKGTYLVYSKYASDSSTLLTFNKNDTSLLYLSTDGVATDQNSDFVSSLYNFINRLGIFDKNVLLAASYQRKSTPGVIYYEFHRDWQQAGYPILNAIGLLNLPENQLLSELDLRNVALRMTPDEDIINTSDNSNGYARATDFNTMTIGVVQASGKVTSITSNIRASEPDIKTSSRTELLTQEEAVASLRAGTYDMFFPIPAGDGAVDMDKVFPDNQARAETAVIEETVLAYLENTAIIPQQSLVPYYVFRGYSNLASGYRIRFIAAVSAVKKDVAGEFIAATTPGIGGQQQNTLTFPDSPVTVLPTPTLSLPPSTTVIPSPVPSVTTPFDNSVCDPEIDELSIYKFQGFKFGQLISDIKNEIFVHRRVYLIPDESTILDRNQLLDLLKEYKEQTYANNDVYFDESWEKPDCPFLITSFSPTLFIYGHVNDKYKIVVDTDISYTDPSLNERSWSVQLLEKNMLNINGFLRKYIYYEYLPVAFSKPQSGWIIEKSKLDIFAEQISKELQLTKDEKDRLFVEIQNAATHIDSSHLYIGLVDSTELNEKLPLVITPHINNIQRYHFYIEGTDREKLTTNPKLKPIKRTETMMVEIGAFKGN